MFLQLHTQCISLLQNYIYISFSLFLLRTPVQPYVRLSRLQQAGERGFRLRCLWMPKHLKILTDAWPNLYEGCGKRMKGRNYLFLGLSEEGWYKHCENCWDSGKLSGTEISVVCPHKKKRNWREELTDFFRKKHFCPSSVFYFFFHYLFLSLYTFHSFVLFSS